jgi:hypothetical protein
MESREAFCEGDDPFVQIATVHVQRGLLAGHRLDDVRIGMPDARHVVVHVDVTAACFVEQIHALAADDVQGLVIEQRRSGSQRLVAAGGKCRRVHRSLFCVASALTLSSARNSRDTKAATPV